METDKYCSSIVHLLRGRELGFRNALTDNLRQCSKYRKWQTCENYGVYDLTVLMNVECYTLLHAKVRFARLVMRYITKLLHMHMSLYEEYIPSMLLN